MILYFITEDYLKKETGISKNVDPQDVMPYCKIAAMLRIREILGGEYFKYLVDKYNAHTLDAPEIILVEHIQPAVAWRAAERALPSAYIQFKNKGPQLQQGEYSTNSDLASLNYLRNDWQNDADFFEERLKTFLKLNKSDYPGYTADSNKKDTPPDKGSQWDHGGLMFI